MLAHGVSSAQEWVDRGWLINTPDISEVEGKVNTKGEKNEKDN